MAGAGLWILALALGIAVWRRDGWRVFSRALVDAGWRSASLVPRLSAAILTAGFATRLVPGALIGKYIGPETGFGGVLLAMAVGSIIPAGPIIAFPLVVVLNDAGAGRVQLITLLTSWSVFALHRVLTFEIPLMGGRFAAIRLVSSLPLPLIAGGLAAVALRWLS